MWQCRTKWTRDRLQKGTAATFGWTQKAQEKLPGSGIAVMSSATLHVNVADVWLAERGDHALWTSVLRHNILAIAPWPVSRRSVTCGDRLLDCEADEQNKYRLRGKGFFKASVQKTGDLVVCYTRLLQPLGLLQTVRRSSCLLERPRDPHHVIAGRGVVGSQRLRLGGWNNRHRHRLKFQS